MLYIHNFIQLIMVQASAFFFGAASTDFGEDYLLDFWTSEPAILPKVSVHTFHDMLLIFYEMVGFIFLIMTTTCSVFIFSGSLTPVGTVILMAFFTLLFWSAALLADASSYFSYHVFGTGFSLTIGC